MEPTAIRPTGFGLFALTDDMIALGQIDIRGEVVRRRAEAIAQADAKGIPRRPLHSLVAEYSELDIRRLQGR